MGQPPAQVPAAMGTPVTCSKRYDLDNKLLSSGDITGESSNGALKTGWEPSVEQALRIIEVAAAEEGETPQLSAAKEK